MIEELSFGDSPIAWVIAQGGFFAGPVLALGSDEQKHRYLPPLCGTDPPACSVAITEPEHGSDSAAIETRARRVDGGYVIDGRKKFIGNAPIADLCVVFATVDPGSRSKGITAFVVERGDAGFVRRRRGCRRWAAAASRRASSSSRSASSPTTAASAAEGEGFSGLMHVFDVARVQLAASTLGLGRAALEHAVDVRARSARRSGGAIHEFQAVSFRLADAKLKLDQARLLTRHAAELADQGKPFSTEAAMAKLAASEASVFATWRRGADARRRRLHPRLARAEVVPRREARRDLGRDERHHAPHRRAEPLLLSPCATRATTSSSSRSQLGPVTARNRFFQVPHCNGMGHRDPTAHAVMRGVKAEGGWAVVCTEEVEIHPSSDVGGFIEGRLWDDADIPAHAAARRAGARARLARRDRARAQRHDVRRTSTDGSRRSALRTCPSPGTSRSRHGG